jgi:hypothetical protein
LAAPRRRLPPPLRWHAVPTHFDPPQPLRAGQESVSSVSQRPNSKKKRRSRTLKKKSWHNASIVLCRAQRPNQSQTRDQAPGEAVVCFVAMAMAKQEAIFDVDVVHKTKKKIKASVTFHKCP